MSDRRVKLLRALAASTTFPGERDAALKKAAELEARAPKSPLQKDVSYIDELLHRSRTIFDPVEKGAEPMEVDVEEWTDPWANFGYGQTWRFRRPAPAPRPQPVAPATSFSDLMREAIRQYAASEEALRAEVQRRRAARAKPEPVGVVEFGVDAALHDDWTAVVFRAFINEEKA